MKPKKLPDLPLKEQPILFVQAGEDVIYQAIRQGLSVIGLEGDSVVENHPKESLSGDLTALFPKWDILS